MTTNKINTPNPFDTYWVLVILIVIALIMFAITGCGPGFKYRVEHNGTHDYTNEITRSGNCIKYVDENCGCSEGKPLVEVCGSYTITTLRTQARQLNN